MTTIDDLLEKYWAGETSLEEESQLREYFSGSEIAPQHRPFAAAFEYQNEIANACLPEDFAEVLLDKIGDPQTTSIVKPIKHPRSWMSIAAAILFLVTVGLFLLKKPAPPKDLAETSLPDSQVPHLIINGKIYYPATEKEAYQLTKQALLLVSSKMTKEPKASIKSLKKIENVHPESWGK